MSVYNTKDMGYGCNSTAFVLHPEKCSEIGGSWNATVKWCAASSLDDVKIIQHRALDKNINTICKRSSNSAIRLLRKPVFNTIAILLLIYSFVGMSTAIVVESRAKNTLDIPLTPQAETCTRQIRRVGNGNPHPSCRWRQVTGTIHCNGGACEAGTMQSREFSYGISGSAGSWASLGFDVSRSYTTGSSYNCGGKKGQSVCVTATVDYTDYTAQEVMTGGNCLGKKKEPFIIYSPNMRGQEDYRCHHGKHCHELGWESWKHDGRSCATYRP